METVYLDNNATTRPADSVTEAVSRAMASLWANPSSVHRAGQQVRQQLELARHEAAGLIGARDRDLVWTSGGTESNNLALRGVLTSAAAVRADRRVLLTSRLEHAAVREPAEALAASGVEVRWVESAAGGWIAPDAVVEALADLTSADFALVSLQWANNETGVLQSIPELSERLAGLRSERGLKAAFHVDGTQAVGKMPVDVATAGVDLLTFAGHKFHGPKGTGALYVRRGVKLAPQNLGGPQERDRRGGTENAPAVIGLAEAARLAAAFLADEAAVDRGRALRDRLETGVLEACPGAVVNGVQAPAGRLWNTTNIAFPRLEAEAILLGLSEQGVYASAGAACSSGSLEPSPVLLAMGVPEILAHGSVRFSLSRETTASEVDRAIKVVSAVIRRLGETMPGQPAD